MSEPEQPVIEDVDLERVLDEMEDDFDDIEAFGNWMPPDGRYTVAFTKPRPGTFTSKQTKKDAAYVAVSGAIQGGDLDGKEFQVGYFTLDMPVKKSIAKGAANTIAGRQTSSWKDVLAVLNSCMGRIAEVKVTTTEKDGRTFRNARIVQMAD
jgi:hypothetical protein